MKGKDLRSQFDQLSAFKAADDVRRNALPQNPDAYKVENSKDFKLPAGVEFKFNADDPLLAQARGVMHDIDTGKLSGQEAFSKLLDLYAGSQVSGEEQIKAARDAEIAKLGPAGSTRVDAVLRWTNAMVGADDAAALSQMLVTAAHVQAFEKLITKYTSGGAGNFRQNGRDGEAPEKLSDEQYDKLSYSEKRAYAAKHGNGTQQVNGR